MARFEIRVHYQALLYLRMNFDYRLDAQGTQDNLDILDDDLEELARPTTDFTKWLDDIQNNETYSRNDDNIQSK